MTQSVPNSVSMSELEQFAKNAKPSVEEPLYDGLTATEVGELAMETLRGMTRKCKDPMVEKCMMLAMAMSWVTWHTDLAQDIMSDVSGPNDEAATKFATCLLRDAGKAQAIYTLVHDISMDNDFILGSESDSE
jgi:hypothetical protein